MAGARLPDVRAPGAGLRDGLLDLPGLTIRRLAAADLGWAEEFLREHVGGRLQARRGELMDALEGGPRCGVVALVDGVRAGLLTWFLEADGATAEVRVLAIADEFRRRGVGRAMLDAAVAELRADGVRRVWLVTTNDNLAALALYQKAGWRLAALRPGAIDLARRTIKPAIPEIGEHGIPLRDELELELHLSDRAP